MPLWYTRTNYNKNNNKNSLSSIKTEIQWVAPEYDDLYNYSPLKNEFY